MSLLCGPGSSGESDLSPLDRCLLSYRNLSHGDKTNWNLSGRKPSGEPDVNPGARDTVLMPGAHLERPEGEWLGEGGEGNSRENHASTQSRRRMRTQAIFCGPGVPTKATSMILSWRVLHPSRLPARAQATPGERVWRWPPECRA